MATGKGFKINHPGFGGKSVAMPPGPPQNTRMASVEHIRTGDTKTTKRTAPAVAALLFVCGLALFNGVVYLVYVFPVVARSWAALGKNLSGFERWILTASELCRASGWFLLPALVVLVVGSLVWLVTSLWP